MCHKMEGKVNLYLDQVHVWTIITFILIAHENVCEKKMLNTFLLVCN